MTKIWYCGNDYYLRLPPRTEQVFCSVGDQIIFSGQFVGEAKIHDWINRFRRGKIDFKGLRFKIWTKYDPTKTGTRDIVCERTK